jgi:hypothetical protein
VKDRRKIRALIGLALTAALLGGVLIGTAVAHKKLIASKISLLYQGSDYGDSMTGSVSSGNPGCKAARQVTLFKAASNGGASTVYTQATTNAAGRFKFDPKGQVFQPGSYFAEASRKVLKRNRKHRQICSRADSAYVMVTPGFQP